jgi:hypothetical protein
MIAEPVAAYAVAIELDRVKPNEKIQRPILTIV